MSEFDRMWNADAAPIECATEEAETVRRAATGDSAAIGRLVTAYLPALRNSVAKFGAWLDQDDARQSAILGLITACGEWTPASGRLSTLVRLRVQDALTEATDAATDRYSIPMRTLQRYWGIMRAAGGDAAVAVGILADHAMAPETFAAVHQAMSAAHITDALDVDDPAVVSVLADVDDRVMVRHAFRAVDETESQVIGLYYGFADYDPVPDAEIGARLGMGRVKTLRTRQRGLDKMRKSLGVACVPARS